jgi:hypothetical protein
MVFGCSPQPVFGVRSALFAALGSDHDEPVVAGWLDESRVLISGKFGRRIHLATCDVATGERFELLDLPGPPASTTASAWRPTWFERTPPSAALYERHNMSMQIVDDEHIRVMVWAGLLPHPEGPLTWQVDREGSLQKHELVEANAAQVGAMLHDQNIAAYEERYGDDESLDEDQSDGDGGARPYDHSAPQHTDWSPIALFNAIQFYVYHSFHDDDHDEAFSVEALQYCGALVRRLGPDLPGWGDPSFPTELMATAEYREQPRGISLARRHRPDFS